MYTSRYRPAGQVTAKPVTLNLATPVAARIATGPTANLAAIKTSLAKASQGVESLAATGLVCPAPNHCASLPSSDAAYQALSTGTAAAWGETLLSMLLRAGLIGAALKAYDWNDKRVVQRALAGAFGIEVFVLAWTWLKMQQTVV